MESFIWPSYLGSFCVRLSVLAVVCVCVCVWDLCILLIGRIVKLLPILQGTRCLFIKHWIREWWGTKKDQRTSARWEAHRTRWLQSVWIIYHFGHLIHAMTIFDLCIFSYFEDNTASIVSWTQDNKHDGIRIKHFKVLLFHGTYDIDIAWKCIQ